MNFLVRILLYILPLKCASSSISFTFLDNSLKSYIDVFGSHLFFSYFRGLFMTELSEFIFLENPILFELSWHSFKFLKIDSCFCEYSEAAFLKASAHIRLYTLHSFPLISCQCYTPRISSSLFCNDLQSSKLHSYFHHYLEN